MNFLVILIIFLIIVFLGYPFIGKQRGAKQSPELKEIDDYIEEQVRSLRRGKVSEGLPREIDSKVISRGVFCPSCGKKISPEERFCTSCGAKLKK